MAVVRLRRGERGRIRPGDAVFDTREHEKGYPLHVGIYVGEARDVEGETKMLVQGVPRAPGKGSMNVATWGDEEAYCADEVGQRRDVDPMEVNTVRLLATDHLNEISQLRGAIRWEKKRRVDPTRTLRGVPLFLEGTCSQFVEHLYAAANLPLVDESRTRQDDSGRLHPTTQLHAFWTGQYPLAIAWDPRLASWEGCLFGERATET